MVKVRQDAWSHEDDLLLAETVLRHIREGSTQLNAFEEVGDKLNRTSAACGFRWNAEVRQRYDQAVAIAKRQRKERKRALAREQRETHTHTPQQQQTTVTHTPEVVSVQDSDLNEPILNNVEPNFPSTNEIPVSSPNNLDEVIHYLQTIKKEFQDSSKSKYSLEKLQNENEQLLTEKETLERKVNQLQKQLNTVQEDYQVLIQIMDRARKMVVFDDDENVSTPAFRMEKNGNLEQVAR